MLTYAQKFIKFHSIIQFFHFKMRVELQKDVFHLAWSPDALPVEEAVRPLLERLHHSLTQYSAALLKNNLDRLLQLLWQAILVALLDQIIKDTEVST